MAGNTIPDDYELPNDWWQTYEAVDVLVKLFRHYLVGLLIGVYYGEEFRKSVYTGFLTWYKDQLIWNTAGHAIDNISAVLSNPNFRVAVKRWLDNYEENGPPAGPLHYEHLRMKSWTEDGIDYGAIVIEGLDAISILENGRSRIFNLTDWHPPRTPPEGHYVLGFPLEWTEYSSMTTRDQKVYHSLKADIACLPLREIRPPADTHGIEFWNDPEAFYGELIPFPNQPNLELGDIEGVSGGPVLSLQRASNRQPTYRLAGIEHRWLPTQRIVKAEPTHRILRLLDSWL